MCCRASYDLLSSKSKFKERPPTSSRQRRCAVRPDRLLYRGSITARDERTVVFLAPCTRLFTPVDQSLASWTHTHACGACRSTIPPSAHTQLEPRKTRFPLPLFSRYDLPVSGAERWIAKRPQRQRQREREQRQQGRRDKNQKLIQKKRSAYPVCSPRGAPARPADSPYHVIAVAFASQGQRMEAVDTHPRAKTALTMHMSHRMSGHISLICVTLSLQLFFYILRLSNDRPRPPSLAFCPENKLTCSSVDI